MLLQHPAPSSTPYPPELTPSRRVAISGSSAHSALTGTRNRAAQQEALHDGCVPHVPAARAKPGQEPLRRLRRPAQLGMAGHHDAVEQERRGVQGEDGGHPIRAIRSPAMAGPMARARLTLIELRAEAVGTCGRGTMSGTSDW